MANIATYTIFDDHDVTDDWFLSVPWRDNVEGTSLGKRVISNALAAYWAFQGWGNNPSDFDQSSFIEPISHFITTQNQQADTSFEIAALGRQKWHYSTPTQPPIIFLDTRTRRTESPVVTDTVQSIRIQRTNEKPRLIDTDTLQELESHIRSINHQNGIILVAAVPLLGLVAEEALQRLAIGVNYSNANDVDDESFVANPQSFSDVLELISSTSLSSVAVLSGDIHEAFISKSTISFPQKNFQTKIMQFTSSAFHNENTTAERIGREAINFQRNRLTGRQFWKLGANKLSFEITYESIEAMIASNILSSLNLSYIISTDFQEITNRGIDSAIIRESNAGDLIFNSGRSQNTIRHRFHLQRRNRSARSGLITSNL